MGHLALLKSRGLLALKQQLEPPVGVHVHKVSGKLDFDFEVSDMAQQRLLHLNA